MGGVLPIVSAKTSLNTNEEEKQRKRQNRRMAENGERDLKKCESISQNKTVICRLCKVELSFYDNNYCSAQTVLES